jgi:hypothetical protein
LYKLHQYFHLTSYKNNVILQGMFVPAIKGQGTEEQQKKWLPMAYKFQIIGCYAQTELGHGSNVQGLETTATFDPKTDEFVIHSPTLTSSKVKSCESTASILIYLKTILFLSFFLLL